MEITLLRTGGIIPIQKKAKEVVTWDEKEIEALIDHIKTENSPSRQARDNTQYQLVYNDKSFSINSNSHINLCLYWTENIRTKQSNYI